MNLGQLLWISFAPVAALLGGCQSSQDQGEASASPISGAALVGPVGRALVFLDSNQNFLLEPWEPFAFTDADGYFSQAKDGSDYCADAATDAKCLRGRGAESGVLRVVNGYDQFTGQPFAGTLTGEISADANNLASPLTTLLSYMSGAERQLFVAALNKKLDSLVLPDDDGAPSVTIEDMKSDLFDSSTALTAPQRIFLINLSLRAHKMADAIGSALTHEYQEAGATVFGDAAGVPADATGMVYAAIVAEWLEPSLNGQGITESAVIERIIADANGRIAAVLGVEEAPIDPIAGLLAARILNLSALIDSAFDSSGLYDDTGTRQRMRAIEVMTGLLRSADCLDDPACRADPAETTKTWLATRFSQFGDEVDVAGVVKQLVEVVKAGGDPGAEINLDDYQRSTLDAGMLQGLSLTSDSGNAVSFTLDADGSVSLALDYAGGTGRMGADGQVIQGHAEPLNDYTLLLDLEIAGITEPVIVQRNFDGSYRFDYDGNSESWNE